MSPSPGVPMPSPASTRGTLAATASLLLALACGGGGSSSAPGTSTATLNVTVSGATPTWAALQDGNGAWKAATVASGTATFPITDASGRYGFAMGFTDGAGARVVHVWQATLQDRPRITYQVLPAAVAVTAPINGGLMGDEVAVGFFGPRTASTTFSSTSLSFQAVPGTSDLMAFLCDGTTLEPRRAWIQRGLSITAATTLPALNLSTPSGLLPANLTVTNPAPGGNLTLAGDWLTASGGLGGSFYRTGATVPTTVPTLNPDILAPGDLQDLWAYETQANQTRWATRYFRTPSPTTFVLPPALDGTVAINPATGQLSATWTSVEGANLLLGSVRQTATNLRAVLHLSKAWSPATAYTAPDFSALAPGWTFVSGQPVTWSLSLQGASYGVALPPGAQPLKDGDWDWSTGLQGAFTPGVPLVPRGVVPAPSREAAAELRREALRNR